MTKDNEPSSGELPKASKKDSFRVGPRVVTGFLLGMFLIFGVGGWAATAKLSGAVISQGIVIVDQNLKQVQHRDGGIISEITIREGDVIEAGQVLLRLEDTQTKAELKIVQSQIIELSARKARLTAEREGATDIIFPDSLDLKNPEVEAVASGEMHLFYGQRTSRESKKQQLELGIVQIGDEIAGLDGQRESKNDEINLVKAEYLKIKDLVDRKLSTASNLYSINRERMRLYGELSEIAASTARANTRISEVRLQILSIDETSHTEAQRELSLIETRLSELIERRAVIQSRLSRMDIRAPIAGTINELKIHTIGGVISPAEILVTIVPLNSILNVEIKLSPVSIEQVSKDQPARLKFSAFNQRTTPELKGKVSRISPATTRDPVTGEPYYLGYVEIPAEELSKLGDSELLPGMPVDVYVQTDERTVISYLVRPLTDQIGRAFRER
jgi:HlyD family secretion protein